MEMQGLFMLQKTQGFFLLFSVLSSGKKPTDTRVFRKGRKKKTPKRRKKKKAERCIVLQLGAAWGLAPHPDKGNLARTCGEGMHRRQNNCAATFPSAAGS